MKKKIYYLVFFIHLAALFFLTREIKVQAKPNKIIVRTLVKSPPVVEKIIPTEKKIVAASTSKPSKKKSTKPKKESVKEEKEINPFLESLQKELAKLELTKGTFTNKELIIPKAITVEEGSKEDSYKHSIIALFTERLKLPAKGSVKTKILINPDGSLETLEIISSENKENEIYLKNQLHNLKLPCFNGESKTYVICFSDV